MNYLIEGIKLSGKSTLAEKIISEDREYSLFSLKNYFELNVCKKENHYFLNTDLSKILSEYVNFLKQLNNYKYMLIRGHIFPFAYAKATNQKLKMEFETIDNKFRELNIELVFLKIKEEEFYERLHDRIRNGRKVREWDKKWENNFNLQEAYSYYFNKSRLRKRIYYEE